MKKPVRRSAPKKAAPAPQTDAETVSIRKISNGYLISRSAARGGTHDEYSPGRPVVTAGGVAKAAPKPLSSREVGFLKGG